MLGKKVSIVCYGFVVSVLDLSFLLPDVEAEIEEWHFE